MKQSRRLFRGLLIFFSLFLLGACAQSPTPAQPEESVFRLFSYGQYQDQLATGFLIAEGQVLSVAHAISDRKDPLYLKDVYGTLYSAELVSIDRTLDLALLSFSQGKQAFTPLIPGDTKELAEGQTLLLHGKSLPVVSLNQNLEAGSSLQGLFFTNLIELSGTIDSGDSGAPVMSESGRVLGLVLARSTQKPERVYALPIETAKTFLKEHQ